ncbi:MAG: NfeD family protein [Lentisphaeria bacterium]
MKSKFTVFLCCFFCLLSSLPGATEKASADRADMVFVLPVKGAIDKGMLMVFRRAFREVQRLSPKAVILELDTPGGGLNETREIIAWIRATRKSGCEVYSYVKQDALSAGAILSLSCKAIYMSESAIIGSAMPISISPLGGGIQKLPEDVKEKMLSAVRAIVLGLAQENGHRGDLAIAMVDPQHPDLMDGDKILCPKGTLLNLTARDAIRIVESDGKPLLAAGMVSDLDAMLMDLQLEDLPLTRFTEEQADLLARLITALGPLLLGLGVLALWIEFKTPGFGVFGFSGISLLVVYFFGHYVAGLAGVEEIFLVFIGMILVAVEIFVIPGFGVTGLAGILCILVGGGLAVVPQLPNVIPLDGVEPVSGFTYLQDAVQSLLMTFAVVAVGVWLLGKILPKVSIYHHMVVETSLNSGNGYVSSLTTAQQNTLLGQKGVSYTVLHPSGIAVINGKRVDVITDGEYIAKNEALEVIAVSGISVVVRKV